MNVIILAIAWMVGVVIADIAGADVAWIWLLGGVACIPIVIGIVVRRRPRMAQVAWACGISMLGAARMCAAQPVPGTQHIMQYVTDTETSVIGWVSGDPKRTEDGQQVILAVEATQTKKRMQAAEGLLLVNLAPYPMVHYGQRLQLTGVMQLPRGSDHPGGFDYRKYLYRKQILVLMQDPKMRVLQEVRGTPALRVLLDFRDRCKGVLLRSLPEPQASIAIGVLLGLQSSIPADVYANFSATGTSHILVVSGWNFTIVATVLAGLTTRIGLGRIATLAIALVVLWTYALFVGATGTVLRAAVMASLAVIARASERRSEGWRLLAAACWGLAIYDPHVLWDLGFELSALATASLFAYGEAVTTFIEHIPILNKPWMAWASEALTATLAAQVLALPIILFHFGNFSIIAPLANILLVPVVPYTMLLGTLTLACGLLWLPLGQFMALLVWGPLTWLTEGARLLAQVPWAAVQLPAFPLSWLLVYYGLVVGGWWWFESAGLIREQPKDMEEG